MKVASLTLIVVLGVVAAGVSGYYVFQDWAALNWHYARLEKLVMSNADLRSLFIAQSQQDAFRINCLADGLGVLLGAILAAIGIHGLCVLHPALRRANRA